MSGHSLDVVDRRIIAALQADGRLSVNELATQVNVSRATAYARLDRLRSNGVITGFTAVVDPTALGLTITAVVLVHLAQRDWRAARPALLALPGLQYLGFTAGEFDAVLIVKATDMAHLRDTVLVELLGIPQVRDTRTVFVLDETLPYPESAAVRRR